MKMYGCFIWLVLLVLVTALATYAQEPSSSVAASIKIEGHAWIGQKVILAIDLRAPGYFSEVPRFDYPEIPGVLLVPPEGHPVLGTTQIDGQSYTVQHYEILLFAKRPGPHEIPAFKIRFGIKRSPIDQKTSPQEVLTPSLNFTAEMPPGAENLPSLISARDLVVEEKWNPLPQACKIGDAFTRTITYTASDVPAMAFPPFPAVRVDGLGVYSKAPVVSDQSERGELRGKRQDTITYICERPGKHIVPATEMTWWKTDDQTLQKIHFPERVFDVAANPALANQIGKNQFHFAHDIKWIAGSFASAIILSLLCRRIPWRSLLRALNFLRPVHLSPLNPPSPNKS